MSQGTIFTKEGIASYLEEANKDYFGRRTWANQFGDISLAGRAGKEYLGYDFGKAAGDAYRTSMMNQAAIQGSGLIQGNKAAAIADNELALEEAYNSYLQNFRSGLQDVNTSMGQGFADVNAQLMRQADYNAKYANAHFDYLQALWNKYEAGELQGDFFNRFDYEGYTDLVQNEDGTIATDMNGNPIRTLKGMRAIKSELFESDGQTLNAKGVRFFDQLENDDTLRQAGYTFGDYLSETDKDLYDWAMSENEYNYAPNMFGISTNASNFSELVGRVSSDEQYTGIERIFGMNEGELNNRFNKLNDSLIALNTAYDERENIETAVDNFSNELTKLVNDFGAEEELVKALKAKGYEVDNVKDLVNEITESYSETVNEAPGFFGETVKAFKDLFAMMSGDSSVQPGPEIITNKDDVKAQFNDLVTTLANYVQNVRRQNEIDFYGKELSTGGEITPYNRMISSHGGVYYNFGMSDGKTTTFLSSAKISGNNARDKEGNNFSISYDGGSYKLEAGNKNLDPAVSSQVKKYIYETTGRDAQNGDVFMYDGQLWVVTKEGTIRNVRNRFGSNDYNELVEKLTGNTKNKAIGNAIRSDTSTPRTGTSGKSGNSPFDSPLLDFING